MVLQPSVSRREEGTLSDWIECVEVYTLRRFGSIAPVQQDWIDTFFSVPSGKYEICADVEGIISSLKAVA